MIEHRQPTAEERLQMDADTRPDWASYGCLFLIFAIGIPVVLFKAAGWLGSLISPEVARVGRIGALVAAVAVLIWILQSFFRFERRMRRRARKGSAAGLVEVVTVASPSVLELHPLGDDEPVLCFDLGEHKLLLLKGQWLYDPAKYGADSPEGDPNDDRLNGLDDPFGFPSSRFVVERVPHSGKVLRVVPKGEYVAPEQVPLALKPHHQFGESLVLEGSFSTLEADLERAFPSR